MRRSTFLLVGLAGAIVVMLVGGGILLWSAHEPDEKMYWEWGADLVYDPDPDVRLRAAEAIRAMGPDVQMGPAFLAALADRDDRVRATVVETLVRNEDLGTLRHALGTPDPRVHRAAIIGFKMLGAKGVSALCQELRNIDEHVRRRAAIALGELGPKAKEAVTALVLGLKDNEPGVRQAAAAALGVIGRDARRAISALKKALLDQNDKVKTDAAESIARIEADARKRKD